MPHVCQFQLTLMSKRLRMPCLAFLLSVSSSTASCSRSIEISIWQTGHSGCQCQLVYLTIEQAQHLAYPVSTQLLHLEILPDTLSVKDVLASRHDRVFGLTMSVSISRVYIVAGTTHRVLTQSAYVALIHIDRFERARLASQYQVGMTSHLTHYNVSFGRNTRVHLTHSA